MFSLEYTTFSEMLSGFNFWSVALRLVLSSVLGGCIGMEREHHGRAAGMRTHILVCLGSDMTAMIGLYTAFVLGFDNDPMRVSAQVISGIGFLGAGTILTRKHSHVTGLTTAAGLWTTASIGIAVGIGFYWVAIIAFLIVMLSMSIHLGIENRKRGQSEMLQYYLELDNTEQMNFLWEQLYKKVPQMEIVPAKSGMMNCIGISIHVPDGEQTKSTVEWLRGQQHVKFVVRMLNS